jgi:hypothetical protein
MTTSRVYFLRYLPPKTTGYGVELVTACCRDDGFTLNQWKEEKPDLFDKPGFYSLLYSDGDTMTIEPKKENK